MTWNPLWDNVFRDRVWGRYPGEDVVRFIARRFYQAPDRAAVRLLEVGCGTGANLWFMAREGFCVHGVEASPAGAAIAIARLDAECSDWRARGGHVAVGDMARLDYPDSFFDAVLDVVAGCYSSREEVRALYAELARVTRPGGHLFIRTFACGCWGEGTGQADGHQMWTCTDGPLQQLGATRFTNPDELHDLLPDWQIDAVGECSTTEAQGQPALRYLVVQATRAVAVSPGPH